MKKGEIWWVDPGVPRGSEPGYRRPAVIVSANKFNASSILTVIVAFLTTNARRAGDPGNVWLPADQTGLPESSTLNVTQIATIDRRSLSRRLGRVPDDLMREVDEGLRLVMEL